ncbi:MAG: hypothetical protein DRN90_00885 [Thermoproteota archaeon]|nr:MAG: hypothetical protein DRN90_00885 [Candidatus Korarchaeota archaeon]
MEKDRERIKRLLEIRENMKKSISSLNGTLQELREILDRLEDLLLEESLVSADVMLEKRPSEEVEKRIIEVRLGEVEVGKIFVNPITKTLVFKPSEKVFIPANSGPIESFLKRKVMRELRKEQPALKFELEEGKAGEVRKIEISNIKEDQINDLIGKLIWSVRKSAELER